MISKSSLSSAVLIEIVAEVVGMLVQASSRKAVVGTEIGTQSPQLCKSRRSINSMEPYILLEGYLLCV